MKDISLHLMDIAENSIAAGASEIRIDIFESEVGNYYRFRVRDNGRGMKPEFLKQATDPWTTTRTTRDKGMGLALLQHNCSQAGGYLRLFSIPEKGCIVEAEFLLHHIDCPPAGNISGTLKLLLNSYPGIHFCYTHHTDEGSYMLDTSELLVSLQGVPLNEPSILRYIQAMISENLHLIKAS